MATNPVTRQPMVAPSSGVCGDLSNWWTADFTLGESPPSFSFSRASGAHGFNSSRCLQWYGNDCARFDAHPSTLGPRGLLLEGQRTNTLFPSNGAAAIASVIGGTVTYAANTGPDGAASFNLLTEDTSVGAHRVETLTNFSLSNGNPATYSVFVKPSARPFIQLKAAGAGTFYANFDLSGSGSVSSVSGCTATVHSLGGGVFRLAVTATATATTGGFGLYAAASAAFATSYTGTGVPAFYWFGMQIELASFVSSYIPTTSAAATRALDLARLDADAFGYNPEQGTFVVEAEMAGNDTVSTAQYLITLSDGSANNNIILYKGGGSLALTASVAGVNSSPSAQVGVNAPFKAALSYKNGDNCFYMNGVEVGGTDFKAASSSTVQTQLNFGNRATANRPGFVWLRRVSYFPSRLPNSTLREITL